MKCKFCGGEVKRVGILHPKNQCTVCLADQDEESRTKRKSERQLRTSKKVKW